MKIYKFFPFALAAMALASCSNEDENGSNPNGENAEIVNAITVSFKNSATYADDTEPGKGSENEVYHAFVFAREAAPVHVPAAPGDYTVKEVGTLGSTTALVEGDGKTEGTLKNMVSFTGVAVGDEVFVIANDPKLTLIEAEKIAHRGTESLKFIKDYKMNLDKEYLGLLSAKAGTAPAKKAFVMAGSDVVPKGANGTKVEVEIGLNREMAKVDFTAQVTTTTTAAAFGQIEIKKDAGSETTWTGADGIIVVRVPRAATPFSLLPTADYFPAKAGVSDYDWKVNENNVDQWPAFDGELAHATYGTTGKIFNNVPFQATAKEYRYTWDATSTESKLTISEKGVLTSPTFYVTPNFSGLADCNNVVVTQATYVGMSTIDPAITSDMLTALNAPRGGDEENPAPWVTNGTDGNLDVLFDAIKKYTGTDEAIKALTTKYTATGKVVTDLIDYKQYQKVYYRADIAQYTGDSSAKNTNRNTYYQMTGTISTLGAKTIKDAVAGSNVDMLVKVTVKPWTVVTSSINM